MRNTTISKGIVIILLFAFTSCGTIFKGTTSTVRVNNGTPPNASVYYKNNFVGNAPCDVAVSKKGIKRGKQFFEIKSPGFNDGKIVLDGQVRAWPLIGNGVVTVLTAGIGALSYLVDGISGHMWSVTTPVNYQLKTTTETVSQDSPPQQNSGQQDNSAKELAIIQVLNKEGILTDNEYSNLKFDILDNKYDYANSKANELIKFKKLMEEGTISKEELMKAKSVILNNSYNYGNNSIYNQILKNKDLKDKGFITEPEFQKRKMEVLR